MTKIAVVRTGLANLASVLAGLKRAGAEPFLTESPSDVESATHVMLPGVGAFGAAMETLHNYGLVEPLRERLAAGRPTIAICVGLQLLAETSEEGAGVEGLGAVPCAVRRLPQSVRVPQLGWNDISADPECAYLKSGYAYFANSFCIETAPPGWKCATVEHGVRFVAAMEKGALLACQFHPELSGEFGLATMKRWFAATGGA